MSIPRYPHLPDGHQDEEIERAPAWLISMGDVTALMLTFFVMLFAMSDIQSEKWDEVISILNSSEQPTEEQIPDPTSEKNIASVDLLPAFPPEYLARIMAEKLARSPLFAAASISEVDGQLVLSIPARILFERGSTTLRGEADAVLSVLASVLRQVGNQIEIVGHAAPEAVSDPAFPGAWDYSLARALAVSKRLVDMGYGGRYTVAGKGDSRFRHLDPALDEATRFELSRRVDIVFRSEADGQ